MRRSPLKRVSDKRKAEGPDYQRAVDRAFARDHWECQARKLLPGIACGGRLDPHHIHPVGSGGPRCDEANIKVVCRRHHDAIHHQLPALARELGLLI